MAKNTIPKENTRFLTVYLPEYDCNSWSNVNKITTVKPTTMQVIRQSTKTSSPSSSSDAYSCPLMQQIPKNPTNQRPADVQTAKLEDEDIRNTPESDRRSILRRRTSRTVNPSIIISPLHSDESDFDDDVVDPTYLFEEKFANAGAEKHKLYNNIYESPRSESSSSDSDNMTHHRRSIKYRGPKKYVRLCICSKHAKTFHLTVSQCPAQTNVD